MATPRKRDYKAEYARAKARAQKAGYQSPYEYKKARKQLRLKPTQKIIPKDQLRGMTPQQYREMKDARLWSLKHSRQAKTKFNPNMSPQQQRDYVQAFVNRKGRTSKEVLKDLEHYLTTYEDMTDEQFDELYGEN